MIRTDQFAEAIRAERESVLEHARGALLVACLGGAVSFEDYQRLDHELCQAAELAGATRH